MFRNVLLLAALLSALAFGQSDRARITGRVLDPTGASIPNATVIVDNPDTDAKRQVTSGADGLYLVDGLLSATYTVTATAPGFATSVVSNLPVSAGQVRTLDMHLVPATVP